MGSDAPKGEHDYLAREAKARVQIDKQLAAAGCVIQSQNALNLSAGPGVAVREFTLEKPYGRVDYILNPLPQRPARRGDRGQAGRHSARRG